MDTVVHLYRPLPSPQTSKQAVHSAWKATEITSHGSGPRSSIGHAAQTSSLGSRALLSPSASAKSSERLWQRQHLEAASVLAQQAALQVRARLCPPPSQQWRRILFFSNRFTYLSKMLPRSLNLQEQQFAGSLCSFTKKQACRILLTGDVF